MKKYLIASLVAVLVMSCNQEKNLLIAENTELITKLDSVSAELESAQKASVTLMEAMSLMDSINLGREMLKVTLESSSQHEDFLLQMNELKGYVEATSLQIDQLEKAAKESKSIQYSFAQTIKTLKAELESKKAEIASIESQLKSVQDNNQKLVVINKLQTETISSQDAEIAAKSLELEMLNQQIVDLRASFKLSEADAYYTQGEAYALAAQRTKLAPAKKKNSYQQALTAYQKAYDLGKAEAQPKIEAIQAKLK
ncbi:hypothetical protein [Roseivirga sp.]|uniref:hypothetical protein n=1 Tax=Roseivirga sp. TaxID=1964215 RepID=UPI003B521692